MTETQTPQLSDATRVSPTLASGAVIRRAWLRIGLAVLLVVSSACATARPPGGGGGGGNATDGGSAEPGRGGGSGRGGRGAGGGARGGGRGSNSGVDVSQVYGTRGLIAVGGQLPYVGKVAFFDGTREDSVLSFISLSFPARSFTFNRDADRFRAGYSIVAELRSDTRGMLRIVDAEETVRVVRFGETQRSEESILFQRFFYALPGRYQLTITVRDRFGARTGVYENDLTIPNTRQRSISSPVTVYEADARASLSSLPEFVANPRATALFGRDSVLLNYVELYPGTPSRTVHYDVRGEGGVVLLRDSVSATGTSNVASALLRIPASGIGIGASELAVWAGGGVDTIRTPLFVTFGEDLPVGSFDELLGYLALYARENRVAELREATPEQRPQLWDKFLRDTDPLPLTPEHEGLIDFFTRVRVANERYREEGRPGWTSDRGRVFITLGEPDQLFSPTGTAFSTRTRNLTWEYSRLNIRLTFQDRTGFGRWLLTSASEAEFEDVARAERVGG